MFSNFRQLAMKALLGTTVFGGWLTISGCEYEDHDRDYGRHAGYRIEDDRYRHDRDWDHRDRDHRDRDWDHRDRY